MSRTHTRVLALDPTARGFAFAVLEGEEFLVDSEHARVKLECAKERFDTVVLRYLPDVLVLENPKGSRRGKAARKLIRRLASRARRQDIAVAFVSRKEVKEYFGGRKQNKYSIAKEIGKRFPELHARVPRKRQLWDGEVERMSVFDAISFAVTVLSRNSADIQF